jgi:hypothetical protein
MLEEKVMRAAIIAACSLVTVFSARSARADDQTTCVDAFTQSQLLRDQKRLLSARDLLRTCMRRECLPVLKGRLVKECTKMLADVEAALPSLVFEAKDGNGNDLSAVQVTMDGQPLADKLDGSAIEVDPGEHKFTFDGGNAHVDKTVLVRAGDDGLHVRVVLGTPSTRSAPAKAMDASATAPSDGNTQRTIGLVVAGVGIAGVAVGSIFGAMALSGSPCNSSNKMCATQSDHDTLVTYETIANVGLGVGLVGLVVGGYLFITARATGSPSALASASIAPWIGWGAAGITARFQ